jgi:hypothetical protein
LVAASPPRRIVILPQHDRKIVALTIEPMPVLV